MQQVQNLCLALQLHVRFEMRLSGGGLMRSSPTRPCDDVGRCDAALCKPNGDATDLLYRPADQWRGGLRIFFGGVGWFAW